MSYMGIQLFMARDHAIAIGLSETDLPVLIARVNTGALQRVADQVEIASQ